MEGDERANSDICEALSEMPAVKSLESKDKWLSHSTSYPFWSLALLNTTAKLLSALVTERVSYILETHGLLPPTHFSGRPGHSTEDSLLLLETTIKHA